MVSQAQIKDTLRTIISSIFDFANSILMRFYLEKEKHVKNSLVPKDVQAIIVRLLSLSASQQLIVQAENGYAGWYKNEAEEMPYRPDEVTMQFWKQMLYFQPGVRVRLPPYISTSIKLYVHGKEFGYYHLFSHLDGTVSDDALSWGEPLFYKLPKDDEFTGSIEPMNCDAVPTEMRDIFPRFSLLAQGQRLSERASKTCDHWFDNHPNWYQDYPRSFVERASVEYRQWYQDHPNWYEGYPVEPFAYGHNVRLRLDRQQLCFHHSLSISPHILTTLDIFAGGYYVGKYCFATYLDGTVNEELSGISPL